MMPEMIMAWQKDTIILLRTASLYDLRLLSNILINKYPDTNKQINTNIKIPIATSPHADMLFYNCLLA